MENLVEVSYAQTGESTKINKYGMREMQERAFAYHTSQYLLLKAPPASGKSRALMFIALDKLEHQNIKKVIVAVPERSIGSSFKKTDLKKFGFFADWMPEDKYNLCTPGSDNSKGKIATFEEFMNSDHKILICTHATLRFAFENIEDTRFNDCLLAIDEFHHVSADLDSSILGNLLHSIMTKSNAHVVAMTGSYFRGDGVAVLNPADEAKFDRVTYNYYEQLNGYTYLKSLGIGYHFYQGRYLSAVEEILDTNKKTIIHIPNVNSLASTKDKYDEVGQIIDIIGEVDHQDSETGILFIKRKADSKILKIADLVEDGKGREKVMEYLRNIKNVDDLDILIALGMAKEGFDWPFCEQALTIGYRGSLTEIVQIIGRCTRDSSNKAHAQFTNLISRPDAQDSQVTGAVNDMLKAITCCLLMEQVLAPKFNFKLRLEDDNTENKPGEIKIRGFKQPTTAKVKNIVESDLNDLKAKILQDTNVLKALPGNIDPVIVNKVLIPKIIQTTYPVLTDEEVEQVRQYVIADSAIKTGEIEETGDQRFIRMANKFINIDDLSIDLIDSINPFQKAFEILSKSLDKRTFRLIQECVDSTKIQMTEEQAALLWPKIKEFVKTTGNEPDLNSVDPHEKELAAALLYIRNKKRNQAIE
ncbi:MAG: DEAD/DEAH box helicase family protein [Alphaproteobacteria bacterium]|nr:DEAD/DEAH box helicase family protein [Alphaproteobacteria bacterium]